jgi:hypothetical protein
MGELHLAGHSVNQTKIAYVNGVLDEVAVYSEPLTQETVQGHFRVGAERSPMPDEYAAMIAGAAGIRSWWRMNENNGTICQDSAGANHATKVGGWAAAAPLISNSPDRSLSLNPGYLNCGNHPSTSLDNLFTVEAWIGVINMPTTGRAYILSKAAAYQLWIAPGGVVGCYVEPGLF